MTYPLYDHGTFKAGPRAAERYLVVVKLTSRSPWKTVALCEHQGSAEKIAAALSASGETII